MPMLVLIVVTGWLQQSEPDSQPLITSSKNTQINKSRIICIVLFWDKCKQNTH